jgi:riboflavin kinase/FMN adenylyltransferase
MVLTFEPHPREFFAPDSAPARLSTVREKLELLADCGATQAMVCPFNARFAALSADEFVEQVLVQGCRVKHLIVGDDFRFGRGRSGDYAFLQQAASRFGFTVEAMGSVTVDGERVSSSGVRRALAVGDMEHAARLLGRPYIIDGQVSHGQKLGRQLGFATANLRIKHNPLPMTGVFAVEVSGLGDKPLPGVANLGVRPTVGGSRPLLEVHLFDFDRDIYGAHISVRFVHSCATNNAFPISMPSRRRSRPTPRRRGVFSPQRRRGAKVTQRYFGDELDALSHKVIGAAIEVHRHLGPGLLEKAYLDCLAIELAEARNHH